MHKPNEPCTVEQRAIARFGEADGMTLLFEATCFPLDDDRASEQLTTLIARADAGATVEQLIGEAHAEMDRLSSTGETA